MSEKLSSSIGRPVQISAENILGYVAKRGKSSFWMHQQYMWAGPYRRFRRHYPQYWDIMNAFYLLAAFRAYNNIVAQYFLNTITRPLRKTYKIKRYFGFLDGVIANYHWIKRQFEVFRLVLAGKFTGGTKRTKIYYIGYGQLTWQTISQNATLHFRPFDHKFGEFGLKLFSARREGLEPIISTTNIKGTNIPRMTIRKPKKFGEKKKVIVPWVAKRNAKALADSLRGVSTLDSARALVVSNWRWELKEDSKNLDRAEAVRIYVGADLRKQELSQRMLIHPIKTLGKYAGKPSYIPSTHKKPVLPIRNTKHL
jgi:YD repeat-containing protein